MNNSLMALALVPFLALNAPKQHVHEFAPEHNLKLPVSMNFSGTTEEEFNSALDKVELVYNPIFKDHNATFVVERSWTDETINAYAYQNDDRWIFSMFGGLARHKEVTKDSFTLVACHEVGHHLGGFPKSSWASNEGESDYYGTLKCLRRIWQDEDSIAVVAEMKIDEAAAVACEKQWSNANDAAVCKRSAMAGKSLARLLSQLGGDKTMPEFDTPDKTKTENTNDNHPAAQCRLDTYFAGSLCTVDFNQDVDEVDPTIGVCTFGEIGGRPSCWFNPNTPVPSDDPGDGEEPPMTDRRY